LNASDLPIIDRFRVEEAMAKQAFFQAAMGNLGPDVNKSLSLNWKSREEQLKQVVAKFLKVRLNAYVEALITFFN
jgi:hypothetical protein